MTYNGNEYPQTYMCIASSASIAKVREGSVTNEVLAMPPFDEQVRAEGGTTADYALFMATCPDCQEQFPVLYIQEWLAEKLGYISQDNPVIRAEDIADFSELHTCPMLDVLSVFDGENQIFIHICNRLDAVRDEIESVENFKPVAPSEMLLHMIEDCGGTPDSFELSEATCEDCDSTSIHLFVLKPIAVALAKRTLQSMVASSEITQDEADRNFERWYDFENIAY